ncbi:MAG TPA: zinc-ribbon domain-containing protein [Pyrinomonadaceae bacterium]|jgi:hypothetical protein
MFCPKCGAENAAAASFCRGCGSNISLVPQALMGVLEDPRATAGAPLSRGERRELKRERKHSRENKKPASIDGAVVPFFGGIGFIAVALAIMLLMPGGHMWGFWMFIPAFFMIGAGVSEYLRWKEQQKAAQLHGYAPPPTLPPPPRQAATLPPPPRRDTAEFHPPASVTEGTTKLLDHDQ